MSVKVTGGSLKKAHERKKSLEQLTAENKELREQLDNAQTQLTDTQVALCDVYELVLGGGEQ